MSQHATLRPLVFASQRQSRQTCRAKYINPSQWSQRCGHGFIILLVGVSLESGNFCTLSALFNQSWFVRG
ncbi:hypothetical protein C0065_28550 (plasmid) [Klebsiella pneumoniae]|nr:hypothetical protein C0065_28550 [Klebsiella pneumoniae]